MATTTKKRPAPKTGDRQNNDMAGRISRIESELVFMRDMERERHYEDEMRRVVQKERSRANAQYWLGLFTGLCYGIALTISYFKKTNKAAASHRQSY